MKAVVTVVGKDRVGIIAAVCTKLSEYQVNVLDISQTVMQGYFTMMMVVDVAACAIPVAELAKELETDIVTTHIGVVPADPSEERYKIMQAACIKGSSVYLFTYTSIPENYDLHTEEVAQMLQHFIIK